MSFKCKIVLMSMPFTLFISLFPAAGLAQEKPVDLSGRWSSPLGVLKIEDLGTEITATAETSGPCFQGSEEIMRGTLVEDTISGKFIYCAKGNGCKARQQGYMVLLVSKKGNLITGSLAIKRKAGCDIPGFLDGNGITLKKLATGHPLGPESPKGPTAIGKTQGYDPRNFAPIKRAKIALEHGKQLLQAGRFEAARHEFEKASTLDPSNPVAFNGIGVTYYARHMYKKALKNYKLALEAGPNFGDAYYNIACIYALTKKPKLAFKYLRIALLNGFVDFAAMRKDPDLKALHGKPEFQQILQGDF
ncbi:MAG: tetratricopeptide repeat protein [Deltaproteobacteria bacterium]|nr:tetratricopeptide repeat protein [Deltaproteobacteria bacterium]